MYGEIISNARAKHGFLGNVSEGMHSHTLLEVGPAQCHGNIPSQLKYFSYIQAKIGVAVHEFTSVNLLS